MQIADDASKLEILLAAHSGHGMPTMVLPGCWDAFSALMIERAGYQAAWLGRGAVALSRLGTDQSALVTAAMMASIVSDIHDASQLALAVDAGNGFGNAFNVARTVTTIERAGAEAIQLADEIAFSGFEDVQRATADMIGKVKAAVDTGTRMLLIARTARLPGESLSELMDRASAYAEAGAEVVSVDDSVGGTDLQRLSSWARSRVPLLLETDQDIEAVRPAGITIVCQPVRFQRLAIEASVALLSPPEIAAQTDTAMIRSLAS